MADEKISIGKIISIIEDFAPLQYQESYDNSGLIIGNPNDLVDSALTCIDVTEKILEEAIVEGHKLIISHHPLVFKGLKRITGKTATERIVSKAIKHNIAIYAAHTNLDSAPQGVNAKICEKLGLKECKTLEPLQSQLVKLVTFVPAYYAEMVRNAMFSAGAGSIGNYDNCSYNLQGEGTFRAGANTSPFVGERGRLHTEPEQRIETIVPRYLLSAVIRALVSTHPYEEVAYDIYPLENQLPNVGLGMVGSLERPLSIENFLFVLKSTFNAKSIRYTQPTGHMVSRIAVCGGSGISLLPKAIAAKADVFVTADVKYHDFFEPDERIMLVDIGHYESEQFATEIIQELLTKKIPTFAIRISKYSSNPINYI